jgi:preprotein translocase subunit SecE
MFQRIKNFFEGVKFEFSKISWPSGEDLWGQTLVVLSVTVVLAAALFVIDKAMSTLVMDLILRQ